MVFMPTLDDLRSAVTKDGRKHAEIARQSNIHPKTFSAFMHGRRGLSIETIEQLAIALGLTVTLTPTRKRKP